MGITEFGQIQIEFNESEIASRMAKVLHVESRVRQQLKEREGADPNPARVGMITKLVLGIE